MKSNLLIATIMFFFSIVIYGQKKAIDNNANKKWQELGDYGISNNEKFIWYAIGNYSSNELVITSPDRKYQKVF